MILGERVGLRAVEKEDLPLMRDWRNQESMRRYFRESGELNLADQQAWFESSCHSGSRHRMFVIVDLAQKSAVGVCGLTNLNWLLRSAEISLYIGRDAVYVDDVLAPDAMSVLMRHGFDNLNLHKVWAEVYASDIPKKTLLERLLFNRDGILRDNGFYGGRYVDSIVYSLLDSEWRR